MLPEPWRTTGWTLWWVLLLVPVVGLYSDGMPGPEGIPGLDKLGHLLMFGLAAAVATLLRSPLALAVVVLHALVSEPLQAWLTTHRGVEVGDLAADLVGIGLGVLLGRWLSRRWTAGDAVSAREVGR